MLGEALGRWADRSGLMSEPMDESTSGIIVDIELENAEDRGLVRRSYRREADIRRATIPAIADAVATIPALPEDIVDRLGIRRMGSVGVEYADGRREELPVAGPLTVRIGDRHAVSDCIVLPRGSDARVG